MSMRSSLPWRRVATTTVAVGALTLVGALAGPVAQAKPVKVGALSGLAVQVAKPADGNYELHASWNDASNAAVYKVKLVDGDTLATLETATVAAPAVEWETTTELGAGDSLKLTVTPTNGKRKGRASTTTVTLPDLTAPTGSYVLNSRVVTTVTLDQLALSDDAVGRRASRASSWSTP